MTDENKQNNEDTVSRRRFMKNTGMVAGGVVGGSLLGGLLTRQFQSNEEAQTKSDVADFQEARMFFSRDEDFAILTAATERLFPEDENGPGAIELGVPYFIDKQLAGSWGTNAKEYMRDPFLQNEEVHEHQHKDSDQDKSGPHTSVKPPTPTPRYQSRMNRGEVFLVGIRKIEDVSQENFDEKFINLKEEEQDEVLQMFENGDVDIDGIASVTFFNLLLQTTIEGAFADPLYGGNKNMMGWKMKEFPGPRVSYADQVEEEEFIVLEQQSLRDYQGGGV